MCDLHLWPTGCPYNYCALQWYHLTRASFGKRVMNLMACVAEQRVGGVFVYLIDALKLVLHFCSLSVGFRFAKFLECA